MAFSPGSLVQARDRERTAIRRISREKQDGNPCPRRLNLLSS